MRRIKLIRLEDEEFSDELSQEGMLVHPDFKDELASGS